MQFHVRCSIPLLNYLLTTKAIDFAQTIPSVLKLPSEGLSRKKVNARATDSNACDVANLQPVGAGVGGGG